MLLTCKPKCTGKKGTTTGLLDLETNEVVCEFCGDDLAASRFAKDALKNTGKIVRPKKAAYQFKCQTCNFTKEVELINETLKGIKCENDCQFNISKFALTAIDMLQKNKETNE